MVGKVYKVPPMPPAPEHTHYLEVGPLRIGIEYRKLDPETIDAAYQGDADQLAEIHDNSPEGGFSDEGISIHVESIEDQHEYLRFDTFADEPHYHYIDRSAGTNTIVAFDVVAHGPMLPWVLGCLKDRLATMLEEAGAKTLSSQTGPEVGNDAAEQVATHLLEIGVAPSELGRHAPASR